RNYLSSTLFQPAVTLSKATTLAHKVLPSFTQVPEVAPVALAAEPNRANCAAITGTDYQSHGERHWYITNCMSPEAQVRLLGAAPRTTSAPVAAARTGGSVIEQFIAGYRSAGGP